MSQFVFTLCMFIGSLDTCVLLIIYRKLSPEFGEIGDFNYNSGTAPVFIFFTISGRPVSLWELYTYNWLHEVFPNKTIHNIWITWSISKNNKNCPLYLDYMEYSPKQLSTIIALHEVFPKKYPLSLDYMKYFQKHYPL